MDIEVIKEPINVCKVICKESKKFFVDGDISVPDIKPDILNVINVYADVFINNKELVDHRFKVDGEVSIYLIYMADDEQGSIRSINTPIHFTEYVELTNLSDDAWTNAKASLIGVESKIINNRKIAVRCSVNLDINICQKMNCEIGKTLSDDRNFECKNEKMSLKTLFDYKNEAVQINETIQLGENDKPIGEILKASVRLINKDFKTSYNKILAKAEALVKLIYVADDGSNTVQKFETRIPVMGFIEEEGLNDSMSICLDYNIKSFSIKPIYQDLKAKSFSVNGDIEICAWIYKDVSFDVITDLYNVEKNIDCKFDSFEMELNNMNERVAFEISQTLLIPELDNIMILDISAEPIISNMNFLDGKIAMDGSIMFDILYYNQTKKLMETKKMELPFQQVVKISAMQGNMSPNVNLSVEEIDYKVVGQNQLQLDLMMALDVVNDKSVNVSSLREVNLLDEFQNDNPSLVVYYVRSGDSLWSIAKRFHTKISDIMAINELKDDLIYPGEQLIIPKRRVLQEMPAWM